MSGNSKASILTGTAGERDITVGLGQRLDRLPITALHRAAILALAALAIAAIERVECKFFVAATSVLIACFGILYGLAENPVLIVLFGALVVMTLQAIVVGLYTYMAELYPTEVRTSGVGFVYGAGRLANVVGPFIISALFTAAGYFSVFVFIALCWLVGAGSVAAFGPRTNGRSLEVVSEREAVANA